MCGHRVGESGVVNDVGEHVPHFGREMELFETERERDIDTVYDAFNPMPSRESNGLLVMFTQKEGGGA